jgi:hypothetical protein
MRIGQLAIGSLPAKTIFEQFCGCLQGSSSRCPSPQPTQILRQQPFGTSAAASEQCLSFVSDGDTRFQSLRYKPSPPQTSFISPSPKWKVYPRPTTPAPLSPDSRSPLSRSTICAHHLGTPFISDILKNHLVSSQSVTHHAVFGDLSKKRKVQKVDVWG